MQHVKLDAAGRIIRFARPGIELNLGSIGKGYALDRMGALLRTQGCTRAFFGGRQQRAGVRRRTDGLGVDVRSRQVAESRLARLRLRDGALATSGAGEQFVDVDGKRYGHVLDPRTGWPASGVISASVVTREAAVADALSTAFLVGGEDLAARYCESNPDTLVILALDRVGGAAPRRVFGRHPGVDVEES